MYYCIAISLNGEHVRIIASSKFAYIMYNLCVKLNAIQYLAKDQIYIFIDDWFLERKVCKWAH